MDDVSVQEQRQPATPEPRILTATLTLLTATTGLVDAVSFLGLGNVFTANMTGNIVFLAFGIAGAPGLPITASIVALASFLLGAVGGGRLATRMMNRPRARWLAIATAGEAILLFGATLAAVGIELNASLVRRWPIIALTALAMGLRNATARRLNIADLTTTLLTLTLTGLGADSTIAGGGNPRVPRRAGAILAMFVGALVGGWFVLHHGIVWPLGLACGCATFATVVLVRSPSV
jgi:uncharacterized membrane protein YoaK (UPF0700 family)